MRGRAWARPGIDLVGARVGLLHHIYREGTFMKWLLIIVVLVVLFFVFQKFMAGRRR